MTPDSRPLWLLTATGRPTPYVGGPLPLDASHYCREGDRRWTSLGLGGLRPPQPPRPKSRATAATSTAQTPDVPLLDSTGAPVDPLPSLGSPPPGDGGGESAGPLDMGPPDAGSSAPGPPASGPTASPAIATSRESVKSPGRRGGRRGRSGKGRDKGSAGGSLFGEDD